MKSVVTAWIALVSLAWGAIALPARGEITTGFDSNLEGWLVTGDNDSAWGPGEGNPGGCLDVNDLHTGDQNYAVAPLAYLGDWSAATAADSLSYDLYLHNTSGGSHSTGPYVFRISGSGGSAWALDAEANYPPDGVWTTFKVSLNPNDWTITSGGWDAILAEVTSLRLNAECVYGAEELRIDNVRLDVSPGVYFAPCVAETFSDGTTGDWTFQGTGGISTPGLGGNGGGFAQIADRSGATSYAIAPSMFLGDWTSLAADGAIRVDLRVLAAGSILLGPIEFIELSGPGGEAHVSLDAADLPRHARIWKTFEFPLRSSFWTQDAGTWEGLLADVRSIRMQLEFYSDGETIGLDNFSRAAASCAPVDDRVAVHDPAVSRCANYSLVGVSAVGHDSLTGALSGLVRATPASGGGLYRVSGADPGALIAPFDRPAHLIYASDGDAFISEDNAGVIYRLDPAGVSTLWVSGFHSGDDDPYGLTVAPPGFSGPNVNPGDFLVTDRGNTGPDEVWAFSPDSAEGERQVMPDPGAVDFFDLAGDADSSVYLCDRLNPNTLTVLHPDGTRSSVSYSIPLSLPSSIVFDRHAVRLYLADEGSRSVYAVDGATGTVTLVADGFAGLPAGALEIDDATRRLWVADNGANRVYEFCLEEPSAVSTQEEPGVTALDLHTEPNPFAGAARIRYRLPKAAPAVVSIYDVRGRLVRRLTSGAGTSAENAVVWDGRDGEGRALPRGAYLARVQSNGMEESVRIVKVR